MNKSTLLLVAMISLLLPSCNKKISPDNPLPAYSSMEHVFEAMKIQPKKLKIDAGSHAYFSGNSGTRYAIYANTLVTADGQSVTGTVDVEVSEYLGRGDMIFSKMLPLDNGEPLISGGELDIRVSQNGRPLRLKDGVQFNAYVPQKGAADPAMNLYWGSAVSNNMQNGVNWTRATQDSFNIERNRTFVYGDDTVAIFSDSFTMCNIDRVLPSAQRLGIKLSLSISGTQVDNNTLLYSYALYKDYNALLPLGAGGSLQFDCKVPDAAVHLVAFTLIDGNFYGGTISITPVAGNNYTITLSETDPKTFKNMLNGL